LDGQRSQNNCIPRRSGSYALGCAAVLGDWQRAVAMGQANLRSWASPLIVGKLRQRGCISEPQTQTEVGPVTLVLESSGTVMS